MTVISLSPLVVIPDFPYARITIKEGVFQPVFGRRDQVRNAPEGHFHYGPIVIDDTFLEEQRGPHPRNYG